MQYGYFGYYVDKTSGCPLELCEYEQHMHAHTHTRLAVTKVHVDISDSFVVEKSRF